MRARLRTPRRNVDVPTLFPKPPVRRTVAPFEIVHADAFEWLKQARPCSVHAVVTDPPHGLVGYTPGQLEKLRNGRGGVWRIPPRIDGCQRRSLPRFTVLNATDRDNLRAFFARLAARLTSRPGDRRAAG